jgi:membrane carboxypeptidase/penicillin-binding protein
MLALLAPFVSFIPSLQDPVVEGALLSLDVATGEVLALVGGWDFDRSQFDRVTQARRQPGSAFKPIIYAAALAKGYTASSILYDRPVVYVDETSGFVWRPQNYGKSFYGPITLREALARSVNNATVHLLRDVGVDYLISFARSLGIQSPLQRDLSLALGSSGLSLLELTRAYGVFAARGRSVVRASSAASPTRSGQVLSRTSRWKTRRPRRPSPERLRNPGPVDVVAGGGAPPEAAPGLSPEHAYLATRSAARGDHGSAGTGGRAAAPAAGRGQDRHPTSRPTPGSSATRPR